MERIYRTEPDGVFRDTSEEQRIPRHSGINQTDTETRTANQMDHIVRGRMPMWRRDDIPRLRVRTDANKRKQPTYKISGITEVTERLAQ